MANSILVNQIKALATRAGAEDKLIKGLIVTAEGAIRTDFAAADAVLDGKITKLNTDLSKLVGDTKIAIETNFDGKIGDLTTLTTTAKGSVVLSLNELKGLVNTAQQTADNAVSVTANLINDTTPDTTKVYSSQKTNQAIQKAVDDLVGGAKDTMNTLKELQTALGDDANFASNITSALAKRVRFDAEQTLLPAELTQAQTNMDVFSKAQTTAAIKVVTDNIGDVSTLDAVALFNAALI